MAYLPKTFTSLLGACTLLIMLSVPGFAATRTPATQTTPHISTQGKWNINNDAFLRILATANRMVLASYPEAQFYEAEGTPQNNSGMTAQDVNQWLFIFNNPATTPNSTLELPYQNGQFGAIKSVAEPFLEDLVITLPPATGLNEAVKLLRQHYTAPFTAVTLRFPLGPTQTEPFYIFSLPDEHVWVFVGTNTHTISTEPMA
ncbi:hypothetical protein [Dictyobacter kobayashii]|uniref:Uncharacterized protein n=1 Tax=Dictyobacter kobayashii TaxID=2014872 RepID=A0A402AP89_9CHLR|nr:hypothetical protein [Dictyobacter kobayashii]GCE20983.1 hypothetical protein KDK_47830 [Dictyobacter kobayashii]